jgi:hypothetical protein
MDLFKLVISEKTRESIAERIPLAPFKFFDRYRKRSVYIKIDSYDTWNMDYTLSLVIVPMLKQLKNTKHGIPASLCNDEVPFEESEVKWNEILDKMIWAFEQKTADDWEKQFHTGEIDLQFVESELEGFSTMQHGPNHTHEFDAEGYAKHVNKMQEGFELFGKYFSNLWD